MPVILPENLPAFDILTREGVMVMSEERALRQDIRPLRIALLNLMPKKIPTETQFARLIGATPLQIDFHLVRMSDHKPRNTPAAHMEAFYRPFRDIRDEKFDAFIITGAPVEHLPFEEVTYWEELREIFDWTQTHVHAVMGVCWGAMAMAYHFHGLKKYLLPKKAFGCFRHRNLAPASPYLRGFSDDVLIPVSRWTEVRQADIERIPALRTLLGSDEVGPCLVEDRAHRALYIFNHLEYDTETLAEEYERDLKAGKPIELPQNYFPNDDPAKRPINRWRSHAHLLFANWINEIYQTTFYDLEKIGTENLQP